MQSLLFKINCIFIFSFLLLLPRQIISDSIGTCYEEYVQDANRHYKVNYCSICCFCVIQKQKLLFITYFLYLELDCENIKVQLAHRSRMSTERK